MEMTSNIAKIKKVDIVGGLPPEMVQYLSLFLTPKDLENALACSPLWSRLFDCNYYWMKKCMAQGYNKLEDSIVSTINKNYSARFPFYWQLVYNYNQLQHNWTNKIFTTTSIITKLFLEIHYFDDEILIVTDNRKNIIFIINSCTGQVKKILSLKKRIFQLVKYQDYLVILMFDASYQGNQWNIKYLQVVTIEGKLLFTKKLDDMFIIIGNYSTSVDFQVYKTLIAINYHTDLGKNCFQIIDFEKKTVGYKNKNISCICFGEEVIALGKDNGRIEMLDLNYNELNISFDHGVELTITKIMISQNYMIAFTYHPDDCVAKSNACVWDLKKNVKLYSIKDISLWDNIYPCTIYQNKFTYLKYRHDSYASNVVLMDLTTGNELLEIVNSSTSTRTVPCNGHYLFVTIPKDYNTGGMTYVRSSKSGRLITHINDIYDDQIYVVPLWYPLRTTETKLAYITDNGDLFIKNYEVNIQ